MKKKITSVKNKVVAVMNKAIVTGAAVPLLACGITFCDINANNVVGNVFTLLFNVGLVIGVILILKGVWELVSTFFLTNNGSAGQANTTNVMKEIIGGVVLVGLKAASTFLFGQDLTNFTLF